MCKKLALQIRVSADEKQTIVEQARESSRSVSDFLRDSALQPHSLQRDADLRRRIVPLACELYDLIARVEEPDLQSQLKKWGCELWRTIK